MANQREYIVMIAANVLLLIGVKPMSWRYLLFFAFTLASFSVNAIAQDYRKSLNELLLGVTDVDVAVNLTDTQAEGCGLTSSSLRSRAVRVFAPAGLKLNDTAGWTIKFDVVTIKVGAGCMSAVVGHSQMYGSLISYGSGEARQARGFLTIDRIILANSSNEARHPSRISEQIEELSREFLSTWQEVNSGTPLVSGSRSNQTNQGSLGIEDVRLAQRVLQSLGFYTGQIDGALGPGTRTGLIQFQRQNGISATGELNEATLLLLRARQ